MLAGRVLAAEFELKLRVKLELKLCLRLRLGLGARRINLAADPKERPLFASAASFSQLSSAARASC